MKLFLRLRFLVLPIILSASAAKGQTLEEVLSSVQERKQVLEQAQAFVRDVAESPDTYYPDGAAGTFELISWTGSPAYPTNGALDSLGIEGRIRLLNEARRHFQIIRAGFVNVAPERIDGTEGTKPPAVIRRFDELSLPTPPVANHLNYLGALRELACKVDALRMTPWPVNCTISTGTHDNSTPHATQTTGADKLQWSEIDSTDTASQWFWAPERPVTASFRVGGRNYEANAGTEQNPDWQPKEYRYVSRSWPSEFTLSYLPQEVSLPSGVDQIVGTCVALAELHNSPYLPASGTGTSATPIPREGGYKVLASKGSAGSQAIGAPQWVVSGAWVASGAANTGSTRNEMVFKPTLASASRYDSYFSNGYPEKYSCVEQAIIFLMIPSFSKGLDVTNEEDERTDFGWDRPRAPGNPGQVAVSGGSVKFGIDAGRGEAILTGGSVQIQHGWTEFPGISGGVISAPMANPAVLWGNPNESTEYVDFFTDKVNHQRVPLSFGTQFRFAGTERDYQVLYETRFDHGRVPLKDWPVTSLLDGSHGWQHGMAYYWEWQKPRLRQILGREALIDVAVGDNDYAHAISVYRIPEGHTFTYDSDGFVATTGLPLVKTVALADPTLGEGDFPSDDLQLTIGADGGEWSVAGSPDLLGLPKYPTNWSVSLLKSGTSTVLLDELWGSFVDYSEEDPNTGMPIAFEAPLTGSTVVVRTMDGSAATETVHTTSFDTLRSLCADPLPRVSAVLVEGEGGTANTDFDYASGANAPDFPVTVTSDVSNEPTTVVQLQTSGLPDFVTRGTGGTQWKTEWDVIADGRLAATSTYGGETNVYGRNWLKWDDGGWSVTTYSAPDGNAANPDDGAVAWTKLETGRVGGSSFPGLPDRVTRSDGTGTTFAWTIGTFGAGDLVATDGLMSGGTVTIGTATTLDFNAGGYPTGSTTTDMVSDLQLAGTTGTTFTDWGAPLSTGDYTTGLLTSWTYDNNLSRLASVTSPLGLATEYSAFDALDRPGQVTANDITATNTFVGPGVSTSYSGTDVEEGTQSATTRDAFGRLTASDTTWNGVPDNLGLTYGPATVGISRTAGPYGTHSASVRQGDGSLASASGPTLAFDGVTGDGLSIVDGLAVTRVELLDDDGIGTGTFRETHTDAWGRVRKVVTPSKSGAESATTSIHYSSPDSTLQRVITIEPSGRVHIAESDPFDASGAVSRSGIDVNFTSAGTANLGATDRYTESVTKVEGTNVVSTLKVTENNGLREVVSTEWAPSTGITVTKINGSEETLTTKPDYTNRSVTTDSTKGWSHTSAVNNLGLSTGSTLSGTGIPTTGLDPVWRADGSLASVELTIGGESHTASFNPDGTLSSLKVPADPVAFPSGRDILEGHTIANGIETLAIDGVTVASKLDGTQVTTSGADIIGKTHTLTASEGGYRETVDPAVGAKTASDFNAAGAATAKTYAVGEQNGDIPGESYDYENEVLASITLPRGGVVALDYSPDGAKDLVSAVWPTMVSGTGPDAFAIPTVTHSYGYDRAGRVDGIGDASGTRSFGYDKGRLVSAVYTSGPLKGYEIIRQRDGTGRDTGFTLYRDGAVIHSASKTPNGVSDPSSSLASGNLKVVPQRDGAGRITGFQWGNATGDFTAAVSQTWQRGVGGRIEAANTDDPTDPADTSVPGVPTFEYLIAGQPDSFSFDTRGRRIKCATTGGTWTYQYGTAGQLVSAVHPTLGTFAYQFDSIGRRTDKGSANNTSLLNQTLAWTHNQNKTLTVRAAQGSRVWINGNEVENFNGSSSYAVPTPGPNGGWVEWNALAILEGQGEGAGNPPANPYASPDAKAQQIGAVWVPPVNESFEFDAAGNRESSAQRDYGWDGRNQLVRARTKAYNTAAKGYDLTFGYDSEGRRYRKHVIEYRNGARVSEKEITFVWDGRDLLYERHQLASGLTTLERKYLWGPDIADGAAGGVGGLLLIRETKGNTTTDIIPLYDGTGHVVALTNTNKDLLATYAYGPFGEKISATGPLANTNPWRYATKYLDEETGLYYFGRRYFDPVTAQWLSREPLGESASLNLYSYCHNDPVNKVDVLGLAEAALDGDKNLTAFGAGLMLIARDDPERAVAMLLASQITREAGALRIGMDAAKAKAGIIGAMESAFADTKREWRWLAAEAGIGADVYRHLAALPGFDSVVERVWSDTVPLLMAATVAEAENRAWSAARVAYQNSAAYKVPEILRGAEYAFRELTQFNSFTRGTCGMEFTPGFAGMDDSIAAGGRAFAFGEMALVAAPMLRGGSFIDDFARAGVRGKAAKSEVTVYRVFGGDARAQGFSWTPVDPRTASNFRNGAGLPSGGASGATNTADFLIQGKVNPADIIKSRSALPLDGNAGGLPELIIDPKNVRLNDFSILNP